MTNTRNLRLVNVTLVEADRLVPDAVIDARDGRIAYSGPADARGAVPGDEPPVDCGGFYAAPGFVDMHVHGGAGADFMDGTVAAFETAVAAHTRHGTTTLVPTSTVARHEQTLAFLEACREMKRRGSQPGAGWGGSRGASVRAVLRGGKGGLSPAPIAPADAGGVRAVPRIRRRDADGHLRPELPGSAAFYRAAAAHGVRLNAGHSSATWDEMAAAFDLGVRHVDHLFCAMSNYVSLRSRFRLPGHPMQAGMTEFVLAEPQVTTEVIADGRHLSPDLLRFALGVKGPDRLALVTDCSRALDMPPGEYAFGPAGGGEPLYSDGEVGLTVDRSGLASSVRGMDFMVRHMVKGVGVDLPTAVRMASLTPARILGLDREVGSLEHGKRTDVVLLDGELGVRMIYAEGTRVTTSSSSEGLA